MFGGKRLSHDGGNIQDLAPTYGRLDAEAEDLFLESELDLANTFTPFSASWASSPFRGTRVNTIIEASMGDLSSSGSWIDDPQQKGSESDELQVEKSQILEQLQLATAEVEGLEERLAAAKRKRARTVSAALEKHKKKQQTEAKEMRAVLGSIQQSSGPGTVRPRSPRNTFSTPTTANLSLGIIQRLQNFTNIHFTSIQNYILTARNLGCCTRQYNISGACFQLDFKLEFTVNEPALSLDSFHIEVPTSVRKELGDFITESERRSLLLPFFEVFTQYAQLDHDRQTLMRKLSQRFPQLVKSNHRSPSRTSTTLGKMAGPTTLVGGPGVQVLVFGGSKTPELVFQWVIDITGDGKIIPQVRMLPRMPRSWRQLDDKATLDAIPSQFVRLIQLKGVEGAVTILLECVYGREVTRTAEPNDPDLSDE
ncbi:hypothetical protein CPB97_006871 [Podila verticillata]|nr:hypothetical protein CPB97_006871 [Podila verticillata]